MKGLPFVLVFTALTFVAWGAYGPVLHHGADAFNHDSLRAFVGVGLAYFLIAVIFPVAMLRRKGEVGKWTFSGTIFSLVAGAVGAVGALGIILALGYGGKTLFVMPLVFGLAPVVNTLVTAALSRTFSQIKPIFIVGIIAAALGAVGVLVFKPASHPVATQSAIAEAGTSTNASHPATGESATGESATGEPATGEPATDETATDETPEDTSAKNTVRHEADASAGKTLQAESNWLGIMGSIFVAAICWGSYGPMLHIGQGKMQGSRMRPFACVGLAYFFIAVAAPLMLIYSRTADAGAWTGAGMLWSFLAGVAGAIGALGVILAFNAGGKPYYVMPLIFGFAPVINTFIALTEAGTWSQIQPMFWLSLGVVIAGAVTVLVTAPKPGKASAKAVPGESPGLDAAGKRFR